MKLCAPLRMHTHTHRTVRFRAFTTLKQSVAVVGHQYGLHSKGLIHGFVPCGENRLGAPFFRVHVPPHVRSGLQMFCLSKTNLGIEPLGGSETRAHDILHRTALVNTRRVVCERYPIVLKLSPFLFALPRTCAHTHINAPQNSAKNLMGVFVTAATQERQVLLT